MSEIQPGSAGEPPEGADGAAPVPARRRRLRAGDSEREGVLEVISRAHAAGRLDADEVDERQNAILRAKFVDELPEHIDDLPEGAELAAVLEAQADAASGTAPPARPSPGAALAPAGRLGGSSPRGEILPAAPGGGAERTTVAIMGGSEVYVEQGTPLVRSFALMGGSEIRLSDVLGPGVQVVVETYAMWAGNEIYVPPGVKVVDETVNIMAGNDIGKSARGDGSNGVLVLRGFSLMAGNEVLLDPDWTPPQLER
ncbi:DUF1707 SHOCT-like domain-containing protein [Brevibacterium album]|uniref:DUF1707 SHOCT-like domain-containing protein n=1 Tax=Brevibacterium album TaxID=417948 RepID=UPI00042A2AC4|nr:DUF1707 domain-containing protein [Brevibacterium album]